MNIRGGERLFDFSKCARLSRVGLLINEGLEAFDRLDVFDVKAREFVDVCCCRNV